MILFWGNVATDKVVIFVPFFPCHSAPKIEDRSLRGIITPPLMGYGLMRRRRGPKTLPP